MNANAFGTIVAHAPYTLNACSSDPHLRELARDMIADDLERMEHLTQQMLLDDPVPETEDLLERARHWNDLKSMAEKIVLQTTVFRVR